MSTDSIKVFDPRFVLAVLLVTFATFAQEAVEEGVDAFEPAVDTSQELEPAVNTSAEDLDKDALEPSVDTSAEAFDSDTLEPAVSTPVLAADVTRQQTDGGVMDRMELGRTEITGNQELPKVLYIVPWQKSDPGDLMGRPVNTLLDEVLAPVDREEFVRQVDYYGDLYGEDEKQ